MTPRRTIITREHVVVITAISRCLPSPTREPFALNVKHNIVSTRDIIAVINRALDHALWDEAT